MKLPLGSLLSLFLSGFAALAVAGEPSQPASSGVIIVMALSVDPSASPQLIRERANAVTSQLRQQPGALDDLVLKSALKSSRTEYLLVMRWRRLEDWEATLANAALWQSLSQTARPFTLERSAVFTQLE
jgi:hypothetical protein